ncbi:MAG: hypothetical protein FWH51_02390 [Dehalococcoidia bacterium]|nr:hypothetical protein [Dehalococcoidia bacterium]
MKNRLIGVSLGLVAVLVLVLGASHIAWPHSEALVAEVAWYDDGGYSKPHDVLLAVTNKSSVSWFDYKVYLQFNGVEYQSTDVSQGQDRNFWPERTEYLGGGNYRDENGNPMDFGAAMSGDAVIEIIAKRYADGEYEVVRTDGLGVKTGPPIATILSLID